jgi:hypothetical protein
MATAQHPNPRVFISYSHDSPEHARRVLQLAERLREDGIDVQLDQYVLGTPAEGWPRWMLDQLDRANFVLVVCTENYYRRFRGQEPQPATGRGADWEGSLITLEMYRAKSRTTKFAPVFFRYQDEPFIPEPISGHTHYLLNSEDNYAKLYAFLTDQAGVVPRTLGPLKTLAREPVEPLTFGGHFEDTSPAGKLDRLPGYMRHKTGSDALGDNQRAPAYHTPPVLTTKDNRLSDPDPSILEIIPYKETPTVDKLLDRIWNSLKSPPKVPDPHTYGREWILYDPKGEYFHKIGTRWAQFIENRQLDERPLRQVGIIPDMTLEVRRPKQRIVVINQRPVVGDGEEPLLLEYSDLKTVGGLLNRIQNSIPELSAESYGTKWILYDPASGRYFDDIVKGDSRVLRTAGIATEDGDTFLDVRRPAIVNPQLGPSRDPGVAPQVEQANVWRWWIGLKTELKVAMIAGLFTIAVATVTGIFNLGVAIYSGPKVSPTPAAGHPSPSASAMPSQSLFVAPSPSAIPSSFRAKLLPKTATLTYITTTSQWVPANWISQQVTTENRDGMRANGRSPTSPDGKWWASEKTATLRVGVTGAKERLTNASFNFIGGAGAFTEIRGPFYDAYARTVTAIVKGWSGPATYELKAQIERWTDMSQPNTTSVAINDNPFTIPVPRTATDARLTMAYDSQLLTVNMGQATDSLIFVSQQDNGPLIEYTYKVKE